MVLAKREKRKLLKLSEPHPKIFFFLAAGHYTPHPFAYSLPFLFSRQLGSVGLNHGSSFGFSHPPPSLSPLFEIAGRETEGGARSVNSVSFLGTLGVSRKNVASKSYPAQVFCPCPKKIKRGIQLFF